MNASISPRHTVHATVAGRPICVAADRDVTAFQPTDRDVTCKSCIRRTDKEAAVAELLAATDGVKAVPATIAPVAAPVAEVTTETAAPTAEGIAAPAALDLRTTKPGELPQGLRVRGLDGSRKGQYGTVLGEQGAVSNSDHPNFGKPWTRVLFDATDGTPWASPSRMLFEDIELLNPLAPVTVAEVDMISPMRGMVSIPGASAQVVGDPHGPLWRVVDARGEALTRFTGSVTAAVALWAVHEGRTGGVRIERTDLY